MFGWMVQRYGNVPAVLNVTLALLPGAMRGVVQEPSFPAASCVVLSLLTHITVVPREIVIGLGLNAVVVSVLAPETMLMVVVLGVGLGFVVELELPHPAHAKILKTTTIVRTSIGSLPPERRSGNPWAAAKLRFAAKIRPDSIRTTYNGQVLLLAA
jgi:hypothetical protein